MEMINAVTARKMAEEATDSEVFQLLDWIKQKISEAAKAGDFGIDIDIKSSDLAKNFNITDKVKQKRAIVAAVYFLEAYEFSAEYSVNATGLKFSQNPQYTIKISWDQEKD